MGNPWMTPEELKWFQSLEMPAVKETARQDGMRESIRAEKKAAVEAINIEWISYLYAKGEKLEAIHYVLDLPEWVVRKVIEKLDALIGKWPEIRPDLSLIVRLHCKGRNLEEISKFLSLEIDTAREVVKVLGESL
jgi:hypothetical protein